MKVAKILPVSLLALALTAPVAWLTAQADAGSPSAEQATAAKLVYGLLSDSRYAYRPRALDDKLSAEVFKRYLESLDGGKLFFTAATSPSWRAIAPASTTRSRAARSARPSRSSISTRRG